MLSEQVLQNPQRGRIRESTVTRAFLSLMTFFFDEMTKKK